LYLYALGVWVLLSVLAVLNGTLREYTYGPVVGEQAAHLLSALILIAVVMAVAYVFLRLVRVPYGPGTFVAVGAIWVLLTVAFEFLFGHYVMGHPWSRLLADYNLLRGRVWTLVLLGIFVAPLIAGRLALRKR
jgi:hypothetical protein